MEYRKPHTKIPLREVQINRQKYHIPGLKDNKLIFTFNAIPVKIPVGFLFIRRFDSSF
jgi:hypothetical protein